MAGTLFGLGLSQQIKPDGTPASGGFFYTYDANTSTPANTYADFSLSSLNAWPMELDSAGRVPSFYVEDGSYRVRITDADGIELVDEQSITSIGASGTESGGSAAQDTTTIFHTGDMLWLPIAGTRSGWVRCNARTIGNGASGATERANSDTQALFEYLWNNFTNSFCPVSGGRGGSAASDFNASKTIGTLDMRSKGIFGLGDMGNSAAGITGESTIAATAIGASTYTVAQANLPNVSLPSTALAVALSSGAGAIISGTAINGIADTGAGTFAIDGASTANITATVSGTIPLGGSGTDIDILSPARVGTFYIKL